MHLISMRVWNTILLPTISPTWVLDTLKWHSSSPSLPLGHIFEESSCLMWIQTLLWLSSTVSDFTLDPFHWKYDNEVCCNIQKSRRIFFHPFGVFSFFPFHFQLGFLNVIRYVSIYLLRYRSQSVSSDSSYIIL